MIRSLSKQTGFTLLEILIALSIFTILAVMTSTAMFHAFNTRAIVNNQADILNKVQLSVSLLEHDIRQMSNRAVRGNDMRLFSALIARPNSLEFTREGVVNPQSMEKRSTLKRVALICENGSLKRRTWNALDTPKRNEADESILLDNLTACNFSYLDEHLQVLNEWREIVGDNQQGMAQFPKAIQLNFTLEHWGNANFIFIVPEALYAKV